MNITRDVINDLLPAYLYGDVSADTRVLVEQFLEQNPEFARSVAQRKNQDVEPGELLKGANMTLSADHDMRTLTRTKAMLARRDAIAWCCCGSGGDLGGRPFRWRTLERICGSSELGSATDLQYQRLLIFDCLFRHAHFQTREVPRRCTDTLRPSAT